MENNKTVALSSPWMTCYKKLNALFGADPELEVEYTDETKTVTISSVNSYKLQALEKILKPSIVFGNITLTIKCKVKNPGTESITTLFKIAFAGNPHLSAIKERSLLGAVEETYVLFNPEVVQFFNDDTTDYYGNYNGLCEDILRDVLKAGILVNISTDKVTE